ncbi:unnamed protein product [Penicillium roqueforti FM164]|uniref:Genomic scaffold, ProqFM164S02 n=1 Tax=Penicillium roqueforti (strain FM164) TaxID=1365484 RepID=W6QG27_PENRF|nr:unnamed protein product [Penicillium roqueforti FM164]
MEAEGIKRLAKRLLCDMLGLIKRCANLDDMEEINHLRLTGKIRWSEMFEKEDGFIYE